MGAPAKKAALVPDRPGECGLVMAVPLATVGSGFLSPVITVYIRKEEEKVYNALLLDSLTVHDFKLQVLYITHSTVSVLSSVL